MLESSTETVKCPRCNHEHHGEDRCYVTVSYDAGVGGPCDCPLRVPAPTAAPTDHASRADEGGSIGDFPDAPLVGSTPTHGITPAAPTSAVEWGNGVASRINEQVGLATWVVWYQPGQGGFDENPDGWYVTVPVEVEAAVRQQERERIEKEQTQSSGTSGSS